MNYKKYSKRISFVLVLDLLLFVLFILCLSPRLTGLSLHEITGAVFLLPVFVHIIIEWKWLTNYTRRFINKSRARDRFNLIMNLTLFIAVIFQIVSGLAISQFLAPVLHINSINDKSWRFWHNRVSTITMFLAGFHLALSWKAIQGYFIKKIRSVQIPRKITGITPKELALRFFILLLLSGIISIVAFIILQPPSAANIYTGNEFARFRPTVGHGFLQLFGETFLIVSTTFVALRFLKVRL